MQPPLGWVGTEVGEINAIVQKRHLRVGSIRAVCTKDQNVPAAGIPALMKRSTPELVTQGLPF